MYSSWPELLPLRSPVGQKFLSTPEERYDTVLSTATDILANRISPAFAAAVVVYCYCYLNFLSYVDCFSHGHIRIYLIIEIVLDLKCLSWMR